MLKYKIIASILKYNANIVINMRFYYHYEKFCCELYIFTKTLFLKQI